ncbi:hypothetical protein [Phenylobacterium sp.]|uniref:hypothetical protein n=1 Tax=Phenylobacterium sp. TaxID=1871053 RepID=UPI0025DE670F|nr:hypothetical protein [Phenylobacterium sp.]MBX3483738.1 hypothetical protein [Phenylobacterium sp.]MCW5758156.1 hypothetical protein [Phenylobacterium sp.]
MATGAVLGAAVAGPAAAQQQLQMPVLSGERVLRFGASAEVYYDTNVSRGSDLLASQRGLQPEDTVFQPRVTATVSQPLGTQMVYLNGFAGYDFHRNNSRLDRANVQVGGGYTARVGICQPSLMGSYSGRQSDLEDADSNTVTNLIQSYGTAAGLRCGRPIGPGVQVMVGREMVKNSTSGRTASDHDSEFLNLALSYSNPTLGQASIAWGYGSNEYPNRIIPGRPVGDGFITSNYTLSYQRQLGQKITLGGSIGRTMVKREFAIAGAPLKFSTTSYAASLDYRMSERIGLRASGARSVKPSNRPGKIYDVSTHLEGAVRYALGTRYDIEVGHAWTETNSNADTAPGTRPVITNSRNNLTFGSVQYAQSDRISWEFTVQRDRRNTNLPQFNYSSTRVGLRTTVTF